MRFESEWPGAIAAPIGRTYDLEEAYIEDLCGRSRDRLGRGLDEGGAEPAAAGLKYWDAPATDLAPGSSTSSSQRRLPRAPGNSDTEPTDSAGWRAWIRSIASIVAELWSRVLREREFRRIAAAWEIIDDRTLKDIGISRYEIEYGRDARDWS